MELKLNPYKDLEEIDLRQEILDFIAGIDFGKEKWVPYIFREKYGIDKTKTLTINDLKKALPEYEVSEMIFTENGKRKRIKKLNYFVLDDRVLGDLLDQLKYDLEGFYLFKWYTDANNYEYRL